MSCFFFLVDLPQKGGFLCCWFDRCGLIERNDFWGQVIWFCLCVRDLFFNTTAKGIVFIVRYGAVMLFQFIFYWQFTLNNHHMIIFYILVLSYSDKYMFGPHKEICWAWNLIFMSLFFMLMVYESSETISTL